jgi:hypothetical protein
MTATKPSVGRTSASPWDALLVPSMQRMDAVTYEDARPGTKLAGLLRRLSDQAGVTTFELANFEDMTGRQVWGLLKAPRACGQVLFEAGRWSLTVDFHGRDVQRAITLLRERGWIVERRRAPLPKRNAERELHEEVLGALDSADIKQRMGV